MTKREVIRAVLEGKRPPYVPWSCSFTHEAEDKLKSYYSREDLEEILENHIIVGLKQVNQGKSGG